MNDDDDQWWDAQCGEYVLGTLRGAERDVLEKILTVDTEAKARITYWKKTLGALKGHMQPVQPPDHVLPQLLQKIREPSAEQLETQESSQEPANAQSESESEVQEKLQAKVQELKAQQDPQREEYLLAQEKLQAKAQNLTAQTAPQEHLKAQEHHKEEEPSQADPEPKEKPETNPPLEPKTPPTGKAHDLTGTWTEDIDTVLAAETREDALLSRNATSLNNNQLHAQASPKNRLWKSLAFLSTVAALVMAALLFRQHTQPVSPWLVPETGSLGVIHNDDEQALWLVTLDKTAQQVSIVALAPPPLQPENSYHLWIVKSANAGVSSVGLLPRASGQSRVVQLTAPIEQAEQFAVSLEPAKGSPDTAPTGPVLFTSDLQQLDTTRQ